MTLDQSEVGSEPLLSVENLRTYIDADGGRVHAVDGVSFTVDRGETVCLVGESGSGKSVTCESLTGIVPQPPAEIVGGTVSFDGLSLLDADDSTLRSVRGNRIAHVFQNPQQALDPVYTVGDQLAEAMTIHGAGDVTATRERAVELLRRVGIPRASERVDDYPHEFSGGMAQRVAIGIGLAADPELLIADEPTTAVDVTVQARLIELLRELTGGGMSLLLVTHDLRVVAALADRVVVMFGGTVMEQGPVETVFARPSHPYTQALFESYDGLDRRGERSARDEIPTDGCRFRRECPHAVDACGGGTQPPTYPTDGNSAHEVSCVHYAPERDPDQILADARGASPGGIPGRTDRSEDAPDTRPRGESGTANGGPTDE
ncbi:peptide/nickel transport system ATP-binding protein [Halalkaliarchaeum desulfuricum]|uniref:Nickel import system ATP-binding protein NikD n=1 Tax=Halalkaliarchaeum desulfuricum TaxID=2055893 RepID=A0A343TKQ4_9EURY|nr:ABC transporter ATP-binding protein [Halalkaliarchaeum desulfuricum]AUX09676.1 peptide/nickel transport system ATP-binding protein [Halalkaliarchaeum desulfuricum]